MSLIEQTFTGAISNGGLWACGSVAFAILHYSGGPKSLTIHNEGVRKYIFLTITWFSFTCWFLGQPLLERVFRALGARCVLRFPDGDSIDVSLDLCLQQTVITFATHPDLFRIPLLPLADGSHVKWFTDLRVTVPRDWSSKAQFSYNQHISTQIFTVALFGLFILDQVRPSLQGHNWALSNRVHKGAVVSSLALVTVWAVACCTAVVQSNDHSMSEDLVSFALGVASSAFTLLPIFRSASADASPGPQLETRDTKA